MARYRQILDCLHIVLGLDTSVKSELVLKSFEFIQTGLPVSLLSSIFGPMRLSSQDRESFIASLPWAIQNGRKCEFIMNIYYEDYFEKSLEELRKDMGVVPFPNG